MPKPRVPSKAQCDQDFYDWTMITAMRYFSLDNTDKDMIAARRVVPPDIRLAPGVSLSKIILQVDKELDAIFTME